jgi:hypothetical protein
MTEKSADEEVSSQESMAAPEIVSAPIQPLNAPSTYASEEATRILGQLVNISESGILHEPTCMLCSSPFRDELEQKYIETKQLKDVKKLLEEKTQITVPRSVIENHMLYHYNREVQEHQKREYIDRINRLSDQNLTTLSGIGLCLAALTERLMGINSIVPAGDLGVAEIERIKSSETSRLMASYNQLLKLKANILGEMKTSGELVTIPRRDFVQIFQEALVNAKADREREAINSILSSLTDVSKSMQ